tara:strand:- start:5309 stop:5497 length:189 start_codon:yes stop_codon:yes gene_type:complete
LFTLNSLIFARAVCALCMRRDDAELMAKLLFDTEAWGIYTHGTAYLRRYVRLMRDVDVNGPF